VHFAFLYFCSIGQTAFQARHEENREIARSSESEHPVDPGEWSRLEREGLPADPSQFGHINQFSPHNQPNLNMQYQNDNDAGFTRAARSIQQAGGIFNDTIIM
jgi:hypothetical protein